MKNTSLYENHKELGATFSEFGGYKMPLWYQSAKKEHLNVLENIGLFDTSHMSLITLEGMDIYNLLENSFSRNISGLESGRAIYGLFRTEQNHVIDDAVLYKITDSNYFIVVNASMSQSIISHLNSFKFNNIEIKDYSDKLCKIDIQGPKSLCLMEKIFGSEIFNSFPYFSFKGSFLNHNVLISRSGYTGEFGFEIFVDNKDGNELWNKLLSEGSEYDICPCGLASRDTLRVGACLPLSHNDIGDWEFVNTPWDFAVSKKITSTTSYTYPYVGYDVRKLHNSKGDVKKDNKVIGKVLSCVTEVSLIRFEDKVYTIHSEKLPKNIKVKGLVAGFIKVNCPLEYNEIVVLSDGKRNLEVEITLNIRTNRTARKSIKNIRGMM